MARRRLEAAILAGQAIETDEDTTFHKVEENTPYEYSDLLESVYSLQYSPDAQYLAIGYSNGIIQLIKTSNGALHREYRKTIQVDLPITCMRYHPKQKNNFLAVGCEGRVYHCDTKDGTANELAYEKGNEICALDFNIYGDYFATGGKDRTVRIYDTTTNQVMLRYDGTEYKNPEHNQKNHSLAIFALKFHPDHSNVFVTGGWENHLKIWDMRTKDGVKRTIPGPHLCGDSLDIKGPYVLTGSWVAKDALQVWDFKECRLLQSIPLCNDDETDGEYLYCTQFCDKGMALAGGSGTKSVKAINLRTQKVIGDVKLDRSVQALDSIRGGRMFCVGGMGTLLKKASLV